MRNVVFDHVKNAPVCRGKDHAYDQRMMPGPAPGGAEVQVEEDGAQAVERMRQSAMMQKARAPRREEPRAFRSGGAYARRS